MIKKIVYKILTIPAFLYNLFYRKRLRVLAYHDVVDYELFCKHIKFLRSKYKIIDMETFKEKLSKNIKLPTNSLLITFDDGDYTVLDKGLPALEKHKCPATLFIITELINTNKDFWFSNARKIEKEKGKSSEEVSAVIRDLKKMSNQERRKRMMEYGEGKRKQLKLPDLDTLKRNNIFIANHSHTHPIFNRCDREEIINELKESRLFFQRNEMKGYEIFAYPNGDFDKQSEELLEEEGIKIAFLFDHKICSKNINPYRISRIRTNSYMSVDELKVKVSGLHSALQKLKRI